MFINIPINWRHGYKLMGGIIHMGNTGGGHYIYYGRDGEKWFIANDSRISTIDNIEDFMKNSGSQSYVLYYMR